MDKIDVIRTLNKAAKIYENQFCNKNLLIIYNNSIKPNIIEIKALAANFLHLTGVIINKESILNDIEDKNSNYKEIFYLKCLNSRLKTKDFELKEDGTTFQKIDVILSTLALSKNAKMIGEYNGLRLYLKTDKLVGNTNSCLGLLQDGNYYIPNTVLQGNIKDDSFTTSQVLAVLSKRIEEPSYSEIRYVAKKIDIQRLLDKIKDRISIDEKLFSRNGNELSPINVNKISYSPISYSGGAAVLSPNAPSISVRSFFENMRNNITGKKIKQQYERLKEEITDLKEQLFQKDRQIAKKDDMIANLTKKVEDVTAERDEFKKVCDFQKNVIKRTNQWLNANLDVKKRLIQDKKEQASVFAPKPSEQTIKQAHKAKSKKGRS